MATKKKMLQAAAGSATGGGLDIDEVFNTYLYTGTEASTQTITNGIDLAGEGGLVWAKARDGSINHVLMDSEQGVGKFLNSNQTYAQQTNSDGMKSFDSDGFTFGNQTGVGWSNDHVYWTFRKAPKFFTMVTWSGNSTMGRTISHDLGADVGFILIKAVDKVDAWYALHKDSNMLVLNQTTAEYTNATTADYFGDGTNIVRPTSTEFTIGSDGGINGTGYNYVAYIFAHNDGDGEFGPDGDQDIIKCGSYTGNQNAVGPVIDLGFEPQWLLIKNASASRPWLIIDVMRGTVVGTTNAGADNYLEANTSAAEQVDYYLSINSTGFQPRDTGGNINASGETYIYMAIRRGTKVPESGTEVFAQDFLRSTEANAAGVQYYSGWPVDMSLFSGSLSVGGNHDVRSRLTGDKRMFSNATDAEASAGTPWWDTNEGWKPDSGGSLNTDALTWMWKRAPGYFDVVAYTGDDVAGRTVSHNLGVAPEMMWVKRRDFSKPWFVYNKDLDASNPSHKYLKLNEAEAVSDDVSIWNDTAPTSSVFTVGDSNNVNSNGNTYIAYLFASLPGISKVGSFTATGSDVNVDCGFTSGARFVLIKRTNSADDWFVFDTERGIVAGNDARLKLNDTTAEASADNIDPYSAGFTMTSGILGSAGNTYIFYAIA